VQFFFFFRSCSLPQPWLACRGASSRALFDDVYEDGGGSDLSLSTSLQLFLLKVPRKSDFTTRVGVRGAAFRDLLLPLLPCWCSQSRTNRCSCLIVTFLSAGALPSSSVFFFRLSPPWSHVGSPQSISPVLGQGRLRDSMKAFRVAPATSACSSPPPPPPPHLLESELPGVTAPSRAVRNLPSISSSADALFCLLFDSYRL